MQYSYTTLALAAFGITTVFAAPTPYLVEATANVGGVFSTVASCVDSDLSCITKKSLVADVTSLPVVSTVATTVEPVVGSAAGGTTSALDDLPIAGSLSSSAVGKTASVVASVVKRFTDFVSPLVGTVTNDAGVLVGIAKRQLPVVGGLVNGVTGTVEPYVAGLASEVGALPVVGDLVPKDVLAGVESELGALPVVGNVIPTDLSTSSPPVAGDVQSSSSTLSKKADSPITVIMGAVDTLKTSVTADLSNITTAVAAGVLESIAPAVKTALLSIATNINSTVLTIVPVVAGTVTPLPVDEVEALISVLSEIGSIVEDIEAVLVPLVSEVGSDVLATIRPELSALLSAILPLVSPLTSFAFSVAGTVTDAKGEGNAIRTAAFDVTAAVSTLLSPETGVVSSLVSK